jgi:STAS-like domain of unknown function (DUF4325)
MPEKIILKIYDIVGGPVWVSSEDGQKVYEKLIAAFKSGRTVDLSFANRQIMITAFLNAAIGQLYNGEFSESFIQEHLNPVDIAADDLAMLKRAVDNARNYFKNPDRFTQAIAEEQ